MAPAFEQQELIDPSRYHHKELSGINGRTYHFVEELAQGKEKATFLLLHGFPDLWYGWRYQIKPWAKRGFRVIVPSQIGYWTTDKPDEVECYGYKSVTSDIRALLDKIGLHSPLIVIGHDWGGMIAWRFCQYHSDLARACVVFCIPYARPVQPNAKLIQHESAVESRLPNFGYQLFFKSDEAGVLLQRNLAGFLGPSHSRHAADKSSERRNAPNFELSEAEKTWVLPGRMREVAIFLDRSRESGARKERIEDPELRVYYDAFLKSDIKHALKWYKTWEINQKEERESGLGPNFPAHIPALFYPAEYDTALPPAMGEIAMKGRFPGKLDVRLVERADHWLLSDKACRDRLTTETAEWIEQNVLGGHSKL